jgi:hypothetical protein
MLKTLRLVLAVAIGVVALVGAVRLVAPADHDPGVRRQLAFLRAELEGGAASRAQQDFPEGYFFLYELYGLTAVNLGREADARWALEHLDSEAGRAPFSAGLTPAYGVFYRGWLNWLRGGVLSLHPGDAALAAAFDRDAADLGAAFDASPTPFLAAYPGAAWPVDSTVAIASLRLHDKLRPPRYAATVARWLSGVRVNLDPATGLMPHTADVDTGQPTSGARATSQSVIHHFLGEIDPEFARAQYLKYRKLFLVRPLGLGPAIREYPKGADGPGDVDSGPLLLGVSLSATVVTIGAARVQGDNSLAAGLSQYGEVAGLPVSTWRTKRYAFGLLPTGDAFLAWSKSARPWVAAPPSPPAGALSAWWRAPLLAVFLLVAAAPWLLRWALRRRRPNPPPADPS